MVPGNAHVDAKKQGKAFLYVPGQVRPLYCFINNSVYLLII